MKLPVFAEKVCPAKPTGRDVPDTHSLWVNYVRLIIAFAGPLLADGPVSCDHNSPGPSEADGRERPANHIL